jgi:AcrR family transcriptional regulator
MRHTRGASRASALKRTQRERLLAGILATINDHGYAGATIANVVARAGVSSATFYDHFTGKDDCFLALYRELSGSLLNQIAHAVGQSPPDRALDTVVRRLTEHAEAQPTEAQFLASDALAAGPRALKARAHTIGQICARVKAAHARASRESIAPDLPAQAVIGATLSLVSQHIRRGERRFTQLGRGLTSWLDHYERPIGEHRWELLNPWPQPNPSQHLSGLSEELRVPALLEGSRLLPDARVQNQRSRILFATADIASQTGYAATSVTAIAARARLGKRVFYEHFRDKQQAFLAIHELAFRQSKNIGAMAYFSAQSWPERVWRCLLATSAFLVAYPAIAHVGCVESHALGLPAIQRLEESREDLTTLLRLDSQNKGSLRDVTAAEANGAAIFEIAYDQISRDHAKDLPRYAYHATYLALAPFLGVQAANRFVEQKRKDAETKRQRQTVASRS